jgi:KUP system potassium uptake protein
MTITSILWFSVARDRWKWHPVYALLVTCVFVTLDIAFLGANTLKILDGGWLPLALGVAVFTLMTTWKRGRDILAENVGRHVLPVEQVLRDIEQRGLPRVPGTAVFMARQPEGIPLVMLHHIKHNKVLHERIVLLRVVTEEIPQVQAEERLSVKSLPHGFWQVRARYGFMEQPNVPEILRRCAARGLSIELHDTTFFLGRETLLTTGSGRMARWRKRLFGLMSRNARSATAYFGIPPNRVVELGAQIQL